MSDAVSKAYNDHIDELAELVDEQDGGLKASAKACRKMSESMHEAAQAYTLLATANIVLMVVIGLVLILR
jgi:hypothetical protein